MLKIGFLLFAFCLITQMTYAQDVIYKKGGKKIHAVVKEIGLDEVKYLKYDDQQGVLYSIAKDLIIKIKFENGETEYFIEDFDNPEFYADQRNKALKFNFFSPLFGYSEFSYEQNLAPGRSFEVKLGGVGLGKNINGRDARGLYVGGSYKFYRKPDHYLRGMRYAHIMKGGYIRPEIIFGAYGEVDPDKRNSSFDERRTVTFGALMVNFGKQWVFSDIIVMDMFLGLGYGFDSTSDEAIHNFTFVKLGDGFSFATSFGFRLGVLLK